MAVASNFSTTLRELADAFEVQTGHEVELSVGSTGKLYALIWNGAPFDLFFAADSERPQLLEEAGKAVPGSRFTYALGRMVLWSADATLVDAAGAVLTGDDFQHLALAQPHLAPYGAAAKELLAMCGLWDSLQSRIVWGESVAQVANFVYSRNAELGFISLAQSKTLGIGSVWVVPDDRYEPIQQDAVVLRDRRAVKDFVLYLRSEAVAEHLMKAGYGVVD